VKGIVGRKIGMTQVFDQETGELTPVTVIEAGPCPVVAIRTIDTDGYDGVQLAFDEVSERKLTKPELGHLKRHGVAPHRRLVELRGAHELVAGDTVTASRSGRASRGRSSATGSTAGPSHTARTTSVPPARSVRRRRPRGSSRAFAWPVTWALSA
jgi:large subunit ribosomal protein L3